METLKTHEKWEYLYETMDSEPADFREKMNRFLNEKGREGWELVSFSFCHDHAECEAFRDYASCLFKRKGLHGEMEEDFDIAI